jgi:site-specific DNA recombinase
MRAAIYTRISRDDYGRGLGVQRQREDCEALCTKRGWVVSQVYEENDTSAYGVNHRPVYERLLADLPLGGIDVIVAWTPERLHRSVRQLEDFIDLIESTKVGVETVKAGVWELSTSHGRLVARLLGAVARHESERMGERISRAHRQAAEMGLWRGSLPLGMRVTAVAGMPEVDPINAPIVAGIFERVYAGESCTAVAIDLNRAGVLTPRGCVWTHTTVRRALGSPAIAGLVKYDDDFVPGAFTGFVDPHRWRALVKRYPLGYGRRVKGPTPSRRAVPGMTLLGGLIRCAEHGFVVMGGSSGGAPLYATHKPGLCGLTITRAGANNIVKHAILHRLRQPGAEEITDALAEDLITVAGCRQGAMLMSQAAARKGRAARLPEEMWDNWSVLEQRDVVRFFFKGIVLEHRGRACGPVVDPTRLRLEWRVPL